MNYDIDNIIQRYDNNEKLKYIFFWGHRPSKDGSITKSCFSQWFDCSFTIDNVTYTTAEQYMMCQKAKLFDDTAVFQRILNANHPSEFKKLGRLVKNFDIKLWEKNRLQIVIDGNMAKFSQNPELKEFLLNTNDRILVEASPYDNIWGIGLNCDAPNVENPHSWKGLNLLGFALMQVRDNLK